MPPRFADGHREEQTRTVATSLSTADHHWIDSSGVSLHAVTWGDSANPPIVLVHGYPDNHSVWKPVAERLAADWFVIAYDVRGAGQSDKPRAVSAYRMTLLAQDLAAVVDALIPGRCFHLAAHDWGSIQSWESVTTSRLEGRILSFTSISGPCLDHMGFWMRNHLFSRNGAARAKAIRQLFSSWYILFFQLPVLAPTLWQLGFDKRWPAYLQEREGVKEPEINRYQREDGRFGVQLYRANFRRKLLRPERRYAHCPVQLVVPDGDNYVSTQLFDELHQWVDSLQREDIEATHWVPLTHPDRIASLIANFARHQMTPRAL